MTKLPNTLETFHNEATRSYEELEEQNVKLESRCEELTDGLLKQKELLDQRDAALKEYRTALKGLTARIKQLLPRMELFFTEVERLRSIPYEEYLHTEHWAIVRKAALDRAGWKCQLCNAAKSLQVHHRTYERLGCEWDSDVIALCGRCHKHFHKGDHE